MRQSMTGFASGQGTAQGLAWTWELRGVNGKGLDLRLRLPDWIDGLEPLVRKAASALVTRGNLQISLRVTSEDDAGALRLDERQMNAVLDAMRRIEAEAMTQGVSLAPSTAAEIVGLRGVLTQEAGAVDTDSVRAAVLAGFEAVLGDFVAMRRSEGAALQAVLAAQLTQIGALIDDAEVSVAAREEERAEKLRSQLARVAEAVEIDEARLAQELALIAVKADVTEELDRLRAHVVAARALLEDGAPIGRKLDFLSQEFNREANTLCAKSGDSHLTQVGLQLKTVIDQMREQVQNVE